MPPALMKWASGAINSIFQEKVGGLGSGLGAVLGGLLVGVLEAMGAGYISSSYKDAIPFVLILLILFFKPRGLFGGKSTDRV